METDWDFRWRNAMRWARFWAALPRHIDGTPVDWVYVGALSPIGAIPVPKEKKEC
mgnify:CR=1 FL=1